VGIGRPVQVFVTTKSKEGLIRRLPPTSTVLAASFHITTASPHNCWIRGCLHGFLARHQVFSAQLDELLSLSIYRVYYKSFTITWYLAGSRVCE
jgi:hypothetical protein